LHFMPKIERKCKKPRARLAGPKNAKRRQRTGEQWQLITTATRLAARAAPAPVAGGNNGKP